jgi:hypothetical protein
MRAAEVDLRAVRYCDRRGAHFLPTKHDANSSRAPYRRAARAEHHDRLRAPGHRRDDDVGSVTAQRVFAGPQLVLSRADRDIRHSCVLVTVNV